MERRAPMIWLAALMAIVAPSPQLRAAPAALHLAPDSQDRWVPFELTGGNQIRFRTMVNGRWVDALLDTGVTDSAVTARFARAAGLKPLVPGHADAIGGSVALAWTGIDRVEVAGLVRTGGRIGIVDLDTRVTEAPVDLLVGSDLLASHALDIDYDARRFRLLPSGRMPFRGATLPLHLAERTGLYMTALPLGGPRPSAMIVDTGDGGMIALNRSVWRSTPRLARPTTTAIAWGLGGRVESEVAVVPARLLPGLGTGEVELRIEADSGFSARKGAAGRIGGGLLLRHRVLLDPRAGRMILAASARASTPIMRSTSGLLVAQNGDRLRVLHVMRGSPAAAGGWRVDEEICAIDGEAVGDADPAKLRDWPTGTPGRQVRLTLCSGDSRSLTLARFY